MGFGLRALHLAVFHDRSLARPDAPDTGCLSTIIRIRLVLARAAGLGGVWGGGGGIAGQFRARHFMRCDGPAEPPLLALGSRGKVSMPDHGRRRRHLEARYWILRPVEPSLRAVGIDGGM